MAPARFEQLLLARLVGQVPPYALRTYARSIRRLIDRRDGP